MPATQSPEYEAAEELLHFMIDRVTDGGDVPNDVYKRARATVLANGKAKALAPRCVTLCRDPDSAWSYIKAQDGLGTYASRRQFLRDQFEPLLSGLERFEESPADALVEDAATDLNSDSVTAAWRKALDRRTRDPDGAITSARTLLESVCKTILDDVGEAYGLKDDLPQLYRRVSKALKLAPSDYTEEQFRRILGGATTVVEGLGSVRNRDSDSHGQGRKSYRPAPRHATFAVNLAGSVAVFLMQTHEERQADDPW
jgi:hypothetical protein